MTMTASTQGQSGHRHCQWSSYKLLLLLRRFLIHLASVLVEDVNQPQRNAVVVLRADSVVKALAFVSIEHPRSDGAQRILVTQLGMKAFPNTYSQVGADVEVVGAI